MAALQELRKNGLPVTYRFITDHDQSGKAIFSNDIEEVQSWQELGNAAHFALNYTTNTYPVSFEDNRDIDNYKEYLQNKPGLVIPGGSVLRVVDMPPESLSPMHRTVSLDYGVVLEGEVYLELDSGESRLMRRGDISIQRGTNHAWRNKSSTTWARMMFVLLESKPIEIGSRTLSEDLGTMPKDVRASG